MDKLDYSNFKVSGGSSSYNTSNIVSPANNTMAPQQNLTE